MPGVVLKSRDESASRRAIGEVLRAFDGLLEERPEQLNSRGFNEVLLPVVERIDPVLVPEVFWLRGLTAPRWQSAATIIYSPTYLVQHLAWYDREVAAALFEPSRDRIEHAEDRELATWSSEFEAWASFDPRAAVARLERVPVGPDASANAARLRVASVLGLSHEQRSRQMWSD